MNANDLGFYNALQTQLNERRRSGDRWDCDVLFKNVLATFAEFSPNTLTKIFETKTEVLKQTLRHAGEINNTVVHFRHTKSQKTK